jgi:hypothetical protein
MFYWDGFLLCIDIQITVLCMHTNKHLKYTPQVVYKRLRIRRRIQCNIPVSPKDNAHEFLRLYEVRMMRSYPICMTATLHYFYKCTSRGVIKDFRWILLLYQFAVLFYVITDEHDPYVGYTHLQRHTCSDILREHTTYTQLQIYLLDRGLDWILCVLP